MKTRTMIATTRPTLIALVIVGTMLGGCHRDQSGEHLARGKDLATKGDHRAAVIEFKNVLQDDAQSLEARYLLGRELMAEGDIKGAEIELQKAYDGHYEPDRVLPLLVKSQMLQGQSDKVISQISNAKPTSPEATAELQTLLGMTRFGQNQPREAQAAFESALGAVPDYPAAKLGMARVLASRNDLAGATAQVDSVLAKNPAQPEALTISGDLSRSRNDMPKAIEAYLAAIKADPRNVMARLDLAGAYAASSQLDLAQQQVTELKKLAPRQPGVNYMDALIAFNRKEFPRANDAITLALNGAPGSASAQMLAGAIGSAMNQPVQTELHLREAIKLNPRNVPARKMLAGLYLRQHDAQKAEEVLGPAVSAAPDDASLMTMTGEIALQKGDFATASKAFDKVARLNPGDSTARTQGAAMDFARGDEAAGFAELEAASKASAGNPNPDIALVLARVQRKQFDQALTAWKTLQKRQPDNPLTYNLRAAIDIGRSDNPAARKSLEHALELQPTYFPAVANLAGLDLRDHDLPAARQRYRTLLAKEPGNLSALLGLAQLESENGGGADVVVPLLKEARRTNPTSPKAVGALVAYYASHKDIKQALTVAQEGLASSPNDPTYLDMVGQLLAQSGSGDQSIATFRKLVASSPDNVEYQLRLGQAQAIANQADSALQTFGTAIRNKPDAYQVQSVAVASLLRAGKVEEAGRLVSQIKQVSPRSPVAPELEADVLLAGKQYDDAAALYRRVLVQSSSSGVAMKNYMALSLGGKAPEATSFLGDWIKNHPKDATVRLFDADLALRAKDYGRAVQNYRAVLDVQPNDPVVLNNLAWALWQQKDPQAVTYAQKANALAPTSPAINDTLGWMLVEQGQVKKGVELLEKAVAAAPGQRDIGLHLAKAQIKDGRRDQARTTLQGLVDAAPDSAEGKESKTLLATL